MNDWKDHVAYLRDTFINAMVSRGFRLTRDESKGTTSDATLVNADVSVGLGLGFPYLPPSVTAVRETPRSWHQDQHGNLCLYTSRDRERQPWLNVDDFLARIDLWFEKNDQGWPDDPPALDMEAYLDLPRDPRLIIHTGTRSLSGDYIILEGDALTLRVTGAGKLPKKSRKGYISGYVTSVGTLTSPLFTWDDIAARIEDSDLVRGAIDRGRIEVLLVEYRRQDQHGVLAITFKRDKQGKTQPQTAIIASDGPKVMRLRGGADATVLANKHVYLIGVGALGSHIADGLSRAGIGTLTVRDGDFLKPGNTTRHLVTSPGLYGVPKAQALGIVLKARPYNRASLVDVNKHLVDPAEATSIFATCDLVVDATADGAVTAMLTDAVAATGHRFLTACLQNEGTTQRVDVVPPLDGADPLPETTRREPTGPEVFEAGCGEPVSGTPPHAVAEAAAMTVRHIIGHLTGNPPTSAGECRDL